MPCTWPAGFPLFQINHYLRIGPTSAYNSDILTIDGNTGTQLDVPPHSIPRPDSKLPNAGPLGEMFTDKVPAWQFVGEACVIDVRELLDAAPDGRSPLIHKRQVMAWEKQHRPLGPGDVVLFYSGFSDKYYKPLPEGRRFVADPVEGKRPGWPDPDPECMEYLASRGVMNLGIDSPSMGPLPDLAEPTHLAGLKHGMIWTEGATGLGELPTTGAFYCMIGPKHAGGPYGEGRAFAIVDDPMASGRREPADSSRRGSHTSAGSRPPLAAKLIESARNKRVADLSVVLSTDSPVSWPGRGVGNHRHPYLKIDFLYAPNIDLFHHTHMLDSHTGTHLVPPAYALPPPSPPTPLPASGARGEDYAPEVQEWLAEYEKKYGPRGTSDVTADKVPLSQTCGWARVIDVRHLIGTTDKKRWPASPQITVADIQAFEKHDGELKPGEIVVFRSGHSDQYFKPFPAGKACVDDPLNGRSEGWPAPGPDAIVYLASKGIRCVATDGPTLGGVEPQRALATYWALGSKGMVGVEFLTNLSSLPAKSYFIFAAVKIRGCHGGPGRAIALY
ncbi:MAG: cyclase family protein [Planctomycetes bacterium]|nr:cyclase family protein [Planctomycetota bacterium]